MLRPLCKAGAECAETRARLIEVQQIEHVRPWIESAQKWKFVGDFGARRRVVARKSCTLDASALGLGLVREGLSETRWPPLGWRSVWFLTPRGVLVEKNQHSSVGLVRFRA